MRIQWLFVISLFAFLSSAFADDSLSFDTSKFIAKGIFFEADNVEIAEPPHSMDDLFQVFRKKKYDSIVVDSIFQISKGKFFEGSNVNVGHHIIFIFNADVEGTWEFEFAYDAGIASGAIIDNEALFFIPADVWIRTNNPMRRKINLSKGWHRFEFAGIDNCCGGDMQFTFKKPGSKQFKLISTDHLEIKCNRYDK